MTKPNANAQLRFGMKSILVVFALLAVLLSYGPLLVGWARSTHLHEAIAKFNNQAANSPSTPTQPRLTQEEVVARIKQRLPRLTASEEIKVALKRVAYAELMPHNASFKIRTAARPKVYAIDLDIVASDGSIYTWTIREAP